MTDKLSPRNHLYPRVCSITGEGMMSGYLTEDHDCIKYEKDLIVWIRQRYGDDNSDLTDEEILQEAFAAEEYYWTEWEEYDHGYYTFDGRLLVEVHTEKCDNCGEETEWTSVHEFCHHCLHPMS